ncbi:hypothetical protein [Marininema halotolerans]|uniref:Uncharacterized protein n=1 Tax=Marininema halotolerans TaxID=1155944 RepID=A0A1I6Q3L6_9BACL|nr:hypothetical protein [Marininema halotolerans]SFS47022.1 hypothetical protein SAMN05444972_102313 [Marininema halotolerans]
MSKTTYELVFDQRLQIRKPLLHVDYEELSLEEQEQFEWLCQEICAEIPPRIQELEAIYMKSFEVLYFAEDDATFFQLTTEMNELSCLIADLNVLFLHIEGKFIQTSVHA